MRNRKQKYLFQLIYTSVLLIIVPVVLFYCLVWNRSYKEIKNLNTEYYNYSVSTFMDNFTEVVEEFKSKTVTFSVYSKTAQGELTSFYYGTPRMKLYPYYYGEAVERLRKYGQENGYDDLGCYYYDEDVLLLNGCKYKLSAYLDNVLCIEEQYKPQFESFFSVERHLYNKILWVPIGNEEGKNEKFLLGVCTSLGKYKEKAILFYPVSYEDVEMSYNASSGKERENYYVIDSASNSILFSVGAASEEYSFLQQELEAGLLEANRAGINNKEQKFFIKKHPTLNLVFLTDTTFDAIGNRVNNMYENVEVLFIYIVLIMLLICIVVIYSNYKPMKYLLKEMKIGNEYEFEAILNAWRNQTEKETEQRVLIMDLLMNQLIYGLPISEKHVRKLGLSSEINSYCVFIIEGYVLKDNETQELVELVENNLRTVLFVTDIIGENSTMLIALMENDSHEGVKTYVDYWAQKNIQVEYFLNNGPVVYELNEIKHSYKMCLSNSTKIDEKDVLSEVRHRNVISDKLKDQVLDYLEVHFTNCEMSQQLLADHFQISVYTLSKMFNNQIGIGFSEYLNTKRIEYAKQLLCMSDAPIYKIAEMVGIPNDNYFSKIFKKYTGCSPAVYRRTQK